MAQDFDTTIGLSANVTSTGQPVDFDGAAVTALAIYNNSGIPIQYSPDGSTWTTIASGNTASPPVSSPSTFRLRKSTSDSYPVPVRLVWTAGDAISAGSINGINVAGLGYQSAAQTQLLQDILYSELQDTSILVIGDSTGANVGTSSWPYLLASYLGALYPRWTVKTQTFNSTVYDSAVTVQTGTGSRTLTIYNATISGAPTETFIGANFSTAIQNIATAPSLIILNHGHNLANTNTAVTNTCRMMELMEPTLLAFSDAGVLITAQNPNRDDTNNDQANYVSKRYAAMRRFGVIDAWTVFQQAGKPISWYVDNVHPNALGHTMWMTAVTPLFKSAGVGAFAANPSALCIARVNYMPNGSFAAFSAAVPTSWTATNLTTSKELTLYESNLNAYSVKLVSDGLGSNAELTINHGATALKRLKGRWVTFGARMYIPTLANNDQYTGLLAITLSSGTIVQTPQTANRDGWAWHFMSVYVPANETSLYTRIYASQGNNGLAKTCYVDRAFLVEGALPSDCSGA